MLSCVVDRLGKLGYTWPTLPLPLRGAIETQLKRLCTSSNTSSLSFRKRGAKGRGEEEEEEGEVDALNPEGKGGLVMSADDVTWFLSAVTSLQCVEGGRRNRSERPKLLSGEVEQTVFRQIVRLFGVRETGKLRSPDLEHIPALIHLLSELYLFQQALPSDLRTTLPHCLELYHRHLTGTSGVVRGGDGKDVSNLIHG